MKIRDYARRYDARAAERQANRAAERDRREQTRETERRARVSAGTASPDDYDWTAARVPAQNRPEAIAAAVEHMQPPYGEFHSAKASRFLIELLVAENTTLRERVTALEQAHTPSTGT